MNILTFDIEDWFHILDNDSTKSEKEWNNFDSRLDQNLDRIIDLLQRKNIKATFFCLGWVAEKHPHIIKKIDALGYEIATHSFAHQLIYEQKKNDFTEDLKKSLDTIQSITGKKIYCYRAPGFSLTKNTNWVFEELVNQGITHDCSIFAANRGHGGYPEVKINEPCLVRLDGIEIKEFPISYYPVFGNKVLFSGGGYFRLLPYQIIKSFSKKSNYIMSYFHPRDFDSEQPRIKDLKWTRKFKSYYGLKRSFPKLEKWLNDFEFVDIKTADGLIDWEKAKRIEIKKP